MNPPPHLRIVDREITAHPITSLDNLVESIPVSDIELNVDGPLSPLVYFVFLVHKEGSKILLSKHVSIATAIYSRMSGNFLCCSETTGNGYNLGDVSSLPVDFINLDSPAQRDKELLTAVLVKEDMGAISKILTPEEINHPSRLLTEYYSQVLRLSDPSKRVIVKDNEQFEISSQKGYYAYFLMKMDEGIRPSIVFQNIYLNELFSKQFDANSVIKEYVKRYYEQPDVKEAIQAAMKANHNSHFKGIAGYWNRFFHSDGCFVRVM